MTKSYVLITPARNEGAFLPGVVDSILKQTVRPARWIIISDGSTDNTDQVAAAAAQQHSFIRLIRVEAGPTRSFGSKAKAFQKGCDAVQDVPFDFIGNLDADITLERDYYERMIREMEQNPKLGVASGACWDKTPEGFRKITISENHAVGAVQFFRRACFEAVGGYRPMTVGGVDSLAVLTARMHGWHTRVFMDVPLYHHKPVDSAGGRTAIRIAYRAGMTEYHIGSHPLFALAKAMRRWRERPFPAAPFIRLYGYFRLYLSGAKRDAPDELVAYLKTEQLRILRETLKGNPPA
ncbi:MAG TPA: glycosyltransferase family A protein [Lacunisphaera sp.]|nr:glycosyltransferase family A protein [Lacunisphaera sp.]